MQRLGMYAKDHYEVNFFQQAKDCFPMDIPYLLFEPKMMEGRNNIRLKCLHIKGDWKPTPLHITEIMPGKNLCTNYHVDLNVRKIS